jgi:hypothetical protein
MRMDIKVKAGKNNNKVTKIDFAKYEVWVKSPPTKGLANKELVKVLANYFNVKPYNLRIVKGLTSPDKIVELTK